jgi:hypothetical protein
LLLESWILPDFLTVPERGVEDSAGTVHPPPGKRQIGWLACVRGAIGRDAIE